MSINHNQIYMSKVTKFQSLKAFVRVEFAGNGTCFKCSYQSSREICPH